MVNCNLYHKMLIFRTKKGLQDYLKKNRENFSLGFVPTMGALHQGHLNLIKMAKKECDKVVVSIYVNPTQFNNMEDLEKYPQDQEKDFELLKKNGIDFVFAPKDKEMYPEGLDKDLDFNLEIFNHLEGKFRPGHFAGVSCIVKKLLEIVSPNVAYFGQKDLQQTIVVKKLVEYYKIPVKIQIGLITREFDGLAMSSRNARLSSSQRKKASFLYQILNEAEEKIVKLLNPKKELNSEKILKKIKKIKLEQIKKCEINKDFKLEYFEICSSQNLQELKEINHNSEIGILIAGYIGKIRLIDNILIKMGVYFEG